MRTNRFRDAFKESANLAGMASAFAISAALLNPIPLLLGVAAEVAYLLFIPDSRWYETRLSKRFDVDVEARRKALKDRILPTLRPDVQDRFRNLESVRSQITTQSQDEQNWFREVVRKLDYLLDKFLLFAGKEAQFRNYLQSLLQETLGAAPSRSAASSTSSSSPSRREGFHSGYDLPQRKLKQNAVPDPTKCGLDEDEQRILETVADIQDDYTHERDKVEGQLISEEDEDTKAILRKRVDVLQRRHEYVGKIGKIVGNLNNQLRLVEETFGLINDEIRARSPEQILADIEEVVVATQSMTETLEELAPYEQMSARLSG